MSILDLKDNTFTDDYGQVLYNIHDSEKCKSTRCIIHNPMPNHLSDLKLYYRFDRGIFERICKHGCGHPDPDNVYFNGDSGVHGCDGCCRKDSDLYKENYANR